MNADVFTCFEVKPRRRYADDLCDDRKAFRLCINVKNFHGSLTTVVRAQNDTTKTANITDTIFDRTLV